MRMRNWSIVSRPPGNHKRKLPYICLPCGLSTVSVSSLDGGWPLRYILRSGDVCGALRCAHPTLSARIQDPWRWWMWLSDGKTTAPSGKLAILAHAYAHNVINILGAKTGVVSLCAMRNVYLRNNNHDAFDEFWFWWTTILFGNGLIPKTFVSNSCPFAGSLHHDIWWYLLRPWHRD